MVIMESYFLKQDRLRELWQKIEKFHFSYLQIEDSPEKIEYRTQLENYISEFLYQAEHHQKFVLPETADVLQRSASYKKDFSGYKAGTGWNAIQMYAGNLIAQPWRQEYREIKTYSGFFKHQIEANLLGAELIFEAMGYKQVAKGVLVLEEPICLDKIATVSRDCLVAYVECQIMKTIWEDISRTPNCNMSWLEILEFRKQNLCGQDQTIKTLNHKQPQKHYQDDHSSNGYSNGLRSHPILPQSTSPVQPAPNHSFPPLSSHQQHHRNASMTLPAPPPPQYIYGNGYCPNPYAHITPPQYGYVQYPQPPHNGYYYTNGSMPNCPYPVPTAQLIEVESAGIDVVDKPCHSKQKHVETTTNNNKNDPQIESWDYVYKDLENQGYSKDLGERGDLLSAPGRRSQPVKDNRRVKITNLDDTMNSLAMNDGPMKMNEALERCERDVGKVAVSGEGRKSQSSSYENLSSKLAKTLPREKTVMESKATYASKTLDVKKLNADRWTCKSCTFLNERAKDICEMCSKSRGINVEQPIEVGGAECSKCTLVNSKSKKECEACGESLQNSPTYI